MLDNLCLRSDPRANHPSGRKRGFNQGMENNMLSWTVYSPNRAACTFHLLIASELRVPTRTWSDFLVTAPEYRSRAAACYGVFFCRRQPYPDTPLSPVRAAGDGST